MDTCTGLGKVTSTIRFACTLPKGLAVFFVVLNTFLSITASLSNVLILIALRKVSSVHPPTKLLFRCLAVSDLCVGLITQPLYVTIMLNSETMMSSRNVFYYVMVREGTFFLGGGRAGEFWDFFPRKVLALPCVLMKTLLTPHL